MCHSTSEVTIEKHGINQYTKSEDSNNVTIHNRGNSRQYSLRRLEKDRPDLLKKVIVKEMSANAVSENCSKRLNRNMRPS